MGCIAFDSIYVDIRNCGCTDPLAINYNHLATLDDGSCVPFIYGCTDSLAANYDSLANTDDGSCQYCDIEISNIDIIGMSTNCSNIGIVTVISSQNYITVWSDGVVGDINYNLCPGLTIVNITTNLGCIVTDTIEIGTIVYGCTDQSANNYDQTATIDDGSCTYLVLLLMA